MFYNTRFCRAHSLDNFFAPLHFLTYSRSISPINILILLSLSLLNSMHNHKMHSWPWTSWLKSKNICAPSRKDIFKTFIKIATGVWSRIYLKFPSCAFSFRHRVAFPFMLFSRQIFCYCRHPPMINRSIKNLNKVLQKHRR